MALVHRCAALACLGLLTATGATARLQVASPYGDATFQARNLRQFAQELRNGTDGRLAAAVHANASLLAAPQILPAVQRGDVPIGEVILSSLAKDNPVFALDAIPFLANGYGEARTLWTISRAVVEAELDRRGLVLLYAVPWPPQHLYAARPVESIGAMKGLRFRTYNAATERIAAAAGAVSLRIELADLPQAIREERVDLMLTSSISGIETRAWSRMRYLYLVGGWSPKNIVFMNKAVFEALDPVDRQVLRDAAARAEARGWAWSEEADRTALRELVNNNVRVQPPSLLLATQFRFIGDQMAGEWVKAADADGLKLVLRYESERRR
jgi:TRAP-type C4-dicarboxylate transport system substrate-binding protein